VRRPGRVERHSRSSRATSPTPTTTRSCSTETLRPITLSVLPVAPILALKIPLTPTARRWNRSSRISPPTRTGMAASGAAVRCTYYAMGFTHASGAFGRYAFTSKVVDSLFVGETENVGNPRTDAEKAYGRSLPKVDLPDYPIHGYEYYDYRHDVVNTT